MARGTRDEVDPDLQVALQAVDQFGFWVQNADTKLTVLAAAAGVLVPAFATDLGAITHALRSADATNVILLAITLTLTGVGLLVVLWHLGRGLLPQLHGGEHLNRFAFPSAANATVKELLARDGTADIEDAWHQAWTLARIADRKFRSFATALRLFAVVLILGVASASIAAAIDGEHTPSVISVNH